MQSVTYQELTPSHMYSILSRKYLPDCKVHLTSEGYLYLLPFVSKLHRVWTSSCDCILTNGFFAGSFDIFLPFLSAEIRMCYLGRVKREVQNNGRGTQNGHRGQKRMWLWQPADEVMSRSLPSSLCTLSHLWPGLLAGSEIKIIIFLSFFLSLGKLQRCIQWWWPPAQARGTEAPGGWIDSGN